MTRGNFNPEGFEGKIVIFPRDVEYAAYDALPTVLRQMLQQTVVKTSAKTALDYYLSQSSTKRLERSIARTADAMRGGSRTRINTIKAFGPNHPDAQDNSIDFDL